MEINVDTIISMTAVKNIRSWESLYAKVLDAKKNLAPGEKIYLIFRSLDIRTTNNVLNSLCKDDDIIFDCVKDSSTHKMLLGICTVNTVLKYGTAAEVEAQRFKLLTIEIPHVFSKKEKIDYDMRKRMKATIDAGLDKVNITNGRIFAYYTSLIYPRREEDHFDLADLTVQAKQLDPWFDSFLDSCKERGITYVLLSLKDIKYDDSLFASYLKRGVLQFHKAGIRLEFSDCTQNLFNILNIFYNINIDKVSSSETKAFLEKLGLGYVALLTKFVEHNTNNPSDYREKDEILAQYIAIIRELNPDSVRFDYCGFKNLEPWNDKFARNGNEDFDKLEMKSITILYEDLGFGDGTSKSRIAFKWHINRLINAGKQPVDKVSCETYTSHVGRTLTKAERVLIPEYIWRSLNSWQIKFNSQALLDDLKVFDTNTKSFQRKIAAERKAAEKKAAENNKTTD